MVNPGSPKINNVRSSWTTITRPTGKSSYSYCPSSWTFAVDTLAETAWLNIELIRRPTLHPHCTAPLIEPDRQWDSLLQRRETRCFRKAIFSRLIQGGSTVSSLRLEKLYHWFFPSTTAISPHWQPVTRILCQSWTTLLIISEKRVSFQHKNRNSDIQRWRLTSAKDQKRCLGITTGYFIFWMPFGLTNTATTFQGSMAVIWSAVKWKSALVYLDDCVIFSEYDNNLMTLLWDTGVTTRLEKKQSRFPESINYLCNRKRLEILE